MAYEWPGNIRELEHAIERGVILAPGDAVRVEDLGLPAAAAPITLEPFRKAKARLVEQFERRYVEEMLTRCDGNITHAAEAASKDRRAFWQLIRKHHIDSGKVSDRARVTAECRAS